MCNCNMHATLLSNKVIRFSWIIFKQNTNCVNSYYIHSNTQFGHIKVKKWSRLYLHKIGRYSRTKIRLSRAIWKGYGVGSNIPMGSSFMTSHRNLSKYTGQEQGWERVNDWVVMDGWVLVNLFKPPKGTITDPQTYHWVPWWLTRCLAVPDRWPPSR